MHLHLCPYHKTFKYSTWKHTPYGNKSIIKLHHVLICRLRSLPYTPSWIGNKHYKNAFHLEHPCYFLKEASSILLVSLWCSFSKTILHNVFTGRKLQNRKKKKESLFIKSTARDCTETHPPTLRADTMGQHFKHSWKIFRWCKKVMLLTLSSSHIHIQAHKSSVWSCFFKKLGYSLPGWQMTAKRFYEKLHWAWNVSGFAQQRPRASKPYKSHIVRIM